MTTVSLIVAMDRNRVIGAGGRLPWHIAADLKRFRRLTLGHHVIMGRKTWESIARALPGRSNIVLTRQAGFRAEGAWVVSCLDDALRLAAGDREVFVIGGAEIYSLALARADRAYVTEIDAAFHGDTWFPPLPANEWREVSRETQRATTAGEPDFAYVTYERVAGPARGAQRSRIEGRRGRAGGGHAAHGLPARVDQVGGFVHDGRVRLTSRAAERGSPASGHTR